MRAAMIVVLMSAASGTAMAGPQFAALDFGSVNPASGASVVATGEGTNAVGLTGNLGQFFPGAFSVSFSFSFDSHSVTGDGVAAFLSFQPTYGSGQLSVAGMGITANLFDGSDLVSTLTADGQVANGAAVGQPIEVLAVAQSFTRQGAAPFQFIGDRGTILVTLDLVWQGANPGHTVGLELLDGSHVEYLTFIPAPGVGAVMALGAAMAFRRRR